MLSSTPTATASASQSMAQDPSNIIRSLTADGDENQTENVRARSRGACGRTPLDGATVGGMTVSKISVSLPEDELVWAQRTARRRKTTVSALLAYLVREERRRAAARRVLVHLGDAAAMTEEQAAEIEREWKG